MEHVPDRVGVDEAGRGCLWGDLFAAAVRMPADCASHPNYARVRDSKRLTPKARSDLCDWICATATSWFVARATAEDIDRDGINPCNVDVMSRAARGCGGDDVLVDGILRVPGAASRAKADASDFNVACASIVAKELRDRYVSEACDADATLDAVYGMRSHKGYGTRRHMEALREHGPSYHHRKSFRF